MALDFSFFEACFSFLKDRTPDLVPIENPEWGIIPAMSFYSAIIYKAFRFLIAKLG